MNIQLAFDIVTAIFTKEGYEANGCKIYSKDPIDIKIYKRPNNGWVEIDFVENKPVAVYQKSFGFIKPKISIPVIGITLKQNGGVLKLDGFIDIPFDYE